ncbi:hypothetical protein OG321_42060 [Streptomyces sp. NBC_00424]|uniref:hypothetical protein n=1 Tax=Streptomyces sp. NBC_00424 TaxID=2903648 RepID=UPI0022529830|nr:hypothetical protein [Streptomyces sp. NBC_00424]MCX5078986.1 hypothetical protein [Streptomyces sp. NBC_00424]
MITLAAVGIGVLHVVKPDVEIDNITLALAAIAVVPWLGDLFESIELPGGTKLQFHKLQVRMYATEQRTEEVRQAAGDAARQARVALVTSGSDYTADGSPAEKVARLTHEFTELRRTEPSSPGRTYRQEHIFAELARLTPQWADMDLHAALGSDDGGTRLTAYARLYAAPEEQYLRALVDAAVEENIHFNQYWALHAVGVAIDTFGADRAEPATARRLRSCMPRLPEDSDRARTLRAVLVRLDDDAAS